MSVRLKHRPEPGKFGCRAASLTVIGLGLMLFGLVGAVVRRRWTIPGKTC